MSHTGKLIDHLYNLDVLDNTREANKRLAIHPKDESPGKMLFGEMINDI